ncbi:MAG: hypothetical protein OHK0023_28980 [Anaerolineae bacterium]
MSDLSGTTLGKYQIIERLGRGGMATVYRAYQAGIDRFVAIKVVHEHLSEDDPQFIERFRREARAVGALRHPNIVQVIDFDVQDGQYFMVMEYLEGETLKARLAHDVTMQPLQAAQIIRKLCDAVAYAHNAGMLHRDIKPANVIFAQQDEPILTDFGIAKLADSTNLTTAGAAVGTPAYMSPEAGRGEKVDERTDIYSLGVVLYEMLAGKPPFDADTPYGVIMMHIEAPLPSIRAQNPLVPDEFERIVMRALAKKRDERFKNAAEMRDALMAFEQQFSSGQLKLPDLKTADTDDNTHIIKETGTVVLKSGAKSAENSAKRQPVQTPVLVVGAVTLAVIGVLGMNTLNGSVGVPGAASSGRTQPPTETLTQTALAVLPSAVPSEPTAGLATRVALARARYVELKQLVRRLVKEGLLDEALESVRAALKGAPADYDLLWLEAFVLVQFRSDVEKLNAGKLSAQRAIEIDPERPEAYIPLGMYYNFSPFDDPLAAIDAYTKAIERNSDDPLVYLLRGRAVPSNDENFAAKLEDYNQAIRLDPSYEDAYGVRAEHYYDARNFASAEQDYQIWLDLNPQPWKHGQVAAVYLLRGKQREAYTLFETTLAKQTLADPAYYAQAAFVARQNQNPSQATAWLKVATELEPNNAAAAYVSALLATDAGNLTEATALLGIVSQEPDRWKYEAPFLNPLFNHQLEVDQARLMRQQGDVAAAIDLYEQSKPLVKDWYAPYLEQAELYLNQGQVELARANILQALEFKWVRQDEALRQQLLDFLARLDGTVTPTLTPSATATRIPISGATIQPRSNSPTQVPSGNNSGGTDPGNTNDDDMDDDDSN